MKLPQGLTKDWWGHNPENLTRIPNGPDLEKTKKIGQTILKPKHDVLTFYFCQLFQVHIINFWSGPTIFLVYVGILRFHFYVKALNS